MKQTISLCASLLFCLMVFAQQSKIISDCTITFSVQKSDANDTSSLGSKTVYLKGKNVREDLMTDKFSQTIFYNNKENTVTVLKNIGQSKYVSYFKTDEWKDKNKVYGGAELSLTNNKKTVLNYECKEAVLKLKNGSSYFIYYCPKYVPAATESFFEVKDIPGIVLQYETQTKSGTKILYTAQKVEFDPVPSMLFEVDAKGYRLLKDDN